MSSKAWYKPSALPRLVRRFARSPSSSTAAIEVWTTTCIVANFGMKRRQRRDSGESSSSVSPDVPISADCSILINPANPDLSGPHKFPYFPKGGPEPEKQPSKDAHHIMGYVSQWGGMEVGDGMMFSTAVIDGMVHQMGGLRLRAECAMKGVLQNGDKCPVGCAVVTSPGGSDLRSEYDYIVHTVPPFYAHHPDPVDFLRKCYRASFDASFGLQATTPRVATPLLGAGCRGFPVDVALDVAATESVRWLERSETARDDGGDSEKVVAFGLLEDDIAEKLVSAIEEASTMKTT